MKKLKQILNIMLDRKVPTIFVSEVRATAPFFLILCMWQISDISSVRLDKLTTSKPCFLNFGFDLIPSLKDYSNQLEKKTPRKKNPPKSLRLFERTSYS